MNTGKQINAMVIALFVTIIAIGAYTIWDPFRSDSAADEQIETAAERGATTFALNCRLCHGDRGEGGALGGRLPQAPALDQDFLRGFENGALSEEALKEVVKLVTNTIICGRVGTFMPIWGADQGGTLNEEQIRQLTVLITGGGNEGFWELAQEHADELDAEATGHATVQMPSGAFADSDTELTVSNAASFSADQYIRIGTEQLEVLRGIAGTEAVAHGRGIAILRDTGVTLRAPIEADGTTLLVDDTTDLAAGEVLQLADEKVRIALILEDEREVVVERGVDDTRAVPHASGASIFGDTGMTLREAVGPDDTLLAVLDSGRFAGGETLQLDDETVRVLGLIKQERLQILDVPSTGQQLAEDIGRTPDSFIVSGADSIEVGAIIRLDGELMEVTAIGDDGDSGTVLDTAVSASDTLISVDDPTFYRPEYVIRVGDEHIRVIEAVDTGQTLQDTIGRAQTTIDASGSDGLSPGMVIRMSRELLRITEIHPAFVEVERGVDGTSQATHTSGAAILKAEVDEDEEPDTGQTLLETADANATTFVVTGMIGLAVDETFLLGDEVVKVTRVEPARLRVERGADGTDREAHLRRASIFDRNLLNVERGFRSTAAAHDEGDSVFLTILEVERSVAGSALGPHSKTAEIFLGHRLIVERGALNTTAAEHENGELVYDFPTSPEGPEPNVSACGQRRAVAEPTPTGPTATPEPTPPGAQEVTVSLTEFAVDVDPASLTDGSVVFQVANDGFIDHNFRVIATDLAPDALPTSGGLVDEEQLEVVASTSDFGAGGTETSTVEQLTPGNYVLICNFIGHYQSGMFVGFEVTPQ